jgi:hypothetical protein
MDTIDKTYENFIKFIDIEIKNRLNIKKGRFNIQDIDYYIENECDTNAIFESCMTYEKDDVGIYLLTLGKLPDEDYLNDNPDVKKYVDKLKNKVDLM